jgi:uncharacterized protein YndB with AHSA1/START domain
LRTVRIEKDFAAPPERVFAYLSQTENLRVLFAPARVEHVRDGETDRTGVDRLVALPLAPTIARGLRSVERELAG